MNKVKAGLMAWVVMALTAVPVAQAAQFHVATAQEFQTALSTAAANGEDDTIFLAAGIYYGNFNFLTSEAQALTLQAETDLKTGDVILDGQVQGRVLKLDAGSNSAKLTVATLIIRNGAGSGSGGGVYARTLGNVSMFKCMFTSNNIPGSYGGGVYVANANNLTINYCTVLANSSTVGGGVCVQNVGYVSLLGNTIKKNRSLDAGGGLYISGATTASLANNQFSDNSAPDSVGGGCFVSGGNSVTIIGNVIERNTSGADGGGIAVQNATSCILTCNLLRKNTATGCIGGSWPSTYARPGLGGGISVSGCMTISIIRNELLQNTSGGANRGGNGAGIYAQLGANCLATCNDNVIVGNNATIYQGGGVYSSLSGNTNTCLRFINNTVYANVCTNSSGGGACFTIANSAEHLLVYNNMIWGNMASSGQDVYLVGYGSEKKLYNNNFHDMSGLWDFASGNIDVDPLFTDTPNGDYHLRANSLCIVAAT